MSRPIPQFRYDGIIAAIRMSPNGATLFDVASMLTPLPPLRNVQRWLGALVQQKRIVRVGSTTAARYKLPSDELSEPLLYGSQEGSAIHLLVNGPMEVRMAADYRRISLESYCPGRTWYLPADARARLAAPIFAENGAAVTPPWRDPKNLNQIAADLAWRSGWLESHCLDETPAPPLQPDVTTWLAQPESPNVRPEVQLVWNQRNALSVLLSRAADVVVTRDWLAFLYGEVTKGMQGARSSEQARGNRKRRVGIGHRTEAPPLLRTESLRLARTTYRPSAESWVIETCFNEILGWSAVIPDPIEQAFFLFAHLVYLQPFAMLNASVACLAVNIPLLRAGLPPVTFAGVRGADLLSGIRGIWELNRTELLRDVFIAAYEDCRAKYGK